MDAIFAFIAGIMFSWYFWPIAFIASLFFESFERNGFAVFTAILAGFGIYGFFGIAEFSWVGLFIGIAIYIGAGFAHAVFRWYRYVDNKVEYFAKKLPGLKTAAEGERNSMTAGNGKRNLETAVQSHKNETNYRNRLDKISYWVLMWPISSLSHLFGDIVILIQKAISQFFSGLFDRITSKANAKLDIDLDNPLGVQELDSV
ncbi:MAG: hypothetical protein DRI24_24015 [Deltaproteobacteria bacterium]|nr:MAG: hypothetical protein DRI24_24015 [Deltaproteobacteria bacterium]